MATNSRAHAQVAGWCGILFVVLSLAVMGIGAPPPDLSGSPEQVVAFYSAHRLAFLIVNYLGVLAFVPGLVMAAYLVGLLKQAEGEGGWLWLSVLGSFLVTSSVGVADLIVFQVTAISAQPGNEAVAKALSDLSNLGFCFLFVTVVGFGVSMDWAVRQTGFLPAWIGRSALLVAALSLLASIGAIVTTGPLAAGGMATIIAFLAFLIWSLALSIHLLKRPATTSA